MTLVKGQEKKFIEEQVKLQVDYYLSSWENARMDGEDVELDFLEVLSTLLHDCKTTVMLDIAHQVGKRNSVMNKVDNAVLVFLISGEINTHEFNYLVKGY